MHLIRCQEKLSQSQALNALVFLYKHVLQQDITAEIDAVRAKERRRLRVVLERGEVERVAGYHIRTVQELLGHKHVQTSMIYTHLARKNLLNVQSPLDSNKIAKAL